MNVLQRIDCVAYIFSCSCKHCELHLAYTRRICHKFVRSLITIMVIQYRKRLFVPTNYIRFMKQLIKIFNMFFPRINNGFYLFHVFQQRQLSHMMQILSAPTSNETTKSQLGNAEYKRRSFEMTSQDSFSKSDPCLPDHLLIFYRAEGLPRNEYHLPAIYIIKSISDFT